MSQPSLGGVQPRSLGAFRASRGRPNGSPSSFQGGDRPIRQRGDAQLEKDENGSRPRLREKDSSRTEDGMEAGHWLRLLPANFENVREARAPKPLHVGRRPSRIAHPAVGDPGSKGRRVAWTTSFGVRPARHRTRASTEWFAAASTFPSGTWMETPTVPGSSNRQDTTL